MPCRRRRSLGQAGVTLIELVVLLAVMGLITALAGPQLYRTFDAFRFSLGRDDVERQLASLNQKAFLENRNLLLLSQPTTGLDNARDQAALLAAQDAASIKLNLTQGWTVTVPQPILYRANGMCDGGSVRVDVGAYAYIYQLAPPRCLPRAN
ncbi:MAG: type II secretion system protein [Alphaproteobacteria bacterium]|jgi:general secretion pathway protein G|nr:type II secretion system protein [Alphaproteobacteria bacterium]